MVVADDPGETVVVDPAGTVTRIPNSSSRMADLQSAQQAALGTLSLGQQGAAPGGSSTLTFETPLQLQPINFIQPQNNDPVIAPATTPAIIVSPATIPTVTPPAAITLATPTVAIGTIAGTAPLPATAPLPETSIILSESASSTLARPMLVLTSRAAQQE